MGHSLSKSALWPLLLLLVLAPAQATRIYKSTDEYGVVSFSDIAPESATEVETLVIEVSQPELTETEQQRLESLRETTDRMATDRREREEHRARLRQIADSSPPYAPYNQAGVTQTSSFVSYSGSRRYRGGYRGHRPWWKPNRPQPTPPMARPPFRPTEHARRTHGAGDYPGSLVRRHYSPRVRQILSR